MQDSRFFKKGFCLKEIPADETVFSPRPYFQAMASNRGKIELRDD
jgi:hypothetical protein